MVLPPMRLNFLRSERDATPVINDASTRGKAISFSRLINMVPKGAIQSGERAPAGLGSYHPIDKTQYKANNDLPVEGELLHTYSFPFFMSAQVA